MRPIGIFEKHDALKQTNKIGVIVWINFFFSFFHIESLTKYFKLFYFLSKGLFVNELSVCLDTVYFAENLLLKTL